jgi:hypothetical protein
MYDSQKITYVVTQANVTISKAKKMLQLLQAYCWNMQEKCQILTPHIIREKLRHSEANSVLRFWGCYEVEI